MMDAQVVPALIGALVREGVDPEAIERAVASVCDLRLGDDIAPGPLVRAFAFEQARRIDRAHGREAVSARLADARVEHKSGPRPLRP